jgi:hypothetical protein
MQKNGSGVHMQVAYLWGRVELTMWAFGKYANPANNLY